MYETDSNIKTFLNLIFQNGLVPVINKPTGVTRTSATTIDHIITNTFTNSKLSTGIIKTDISDHFPNFLICGKTEIDTYSETTNIFKRYINEDSINNFNEILNLASWENFHKITYPNKAYDSFLELITSFYEAAFPKVKIKIKTKKSVITVDNKRIAQVIKTKAKAI